MAIALPAAGLVAAHQSNVEARSRAGSATSTSALAAFTNQVTTVAPNWLVASPSTDQSGATDTAFLNSTLTSLGTGGSLWLAPGAWYVNGPITPLAGQRVSGLHGANQSGDGAGSGYGTVIHPVGTSWPSLNGCQAVFAYPTPLSQGELTDLWIDCGKFGGPNLSGVAAIGSVNAISLSRVGVYKAPTNGFLLQTDSATNNVPDGWCLDTCLAQSCSGAGFSGRFNDASLINCHAQGCTGDGFFISSGNAKLTGCRGDPSCLAAVPSGTTRAASTSSTATAPHRATASAPRLWSTAARSAATGTTTGTRSIRAFSMRGSGCAARTRSSSGRFL